MDWIETLNAAAACLHGAQAVVVMGLIPWLNSKPPGDPFANGGRFEITRSIALVNNHTQLSSGVFDVRAAILSFFVLSCAFHSLAAALWSGRLGSILHYVEYSLSASVALCAIAVEAGVRDAYTLQSQFMLVFATMILGIAAELVQSQQRPFFPSLLLHLAGWATCLSAYVPIFDTYMQTARLSPEGHKPPAFVTALVFTEFALFACFGFVQTYALFARWRVFLMSAESKQIMQLAIVPEEDEDCYLFPHDAQTIRDIEEQIEIVFIVLSLVAKTLLCWIVLSPLLVG